MESTSIGAIGIFIGILVFLSYFFIKMGNFGFWGIAHKLPNEFMQFAQENEDVWVISETPISLPSETHTGPFKFVAYGNIYTLYALADELESSQAKFIEMFSDSIPEKPFPFVSLLFLLYPVLAMASYPSGELIEVLGYGFSNLGYLLFAALIPGSFRIFGMENRVQIGIGGAIFFILGLFLVNF